jgi:hypothetical protein
LRNSQFRNTLAFRNSAKRKQVGQQRFDLVKQMHRRRLGQCDGDRVQLPADGL